MTALAAQHMLLQMLCCSLLPGSDAPTDVMHLPLLQRAAIHLGSWLEYLSVLKSSCRLPQGDEVMTGAARNLVQQRLKLNNKVALVTGGATAAQPGCLSYFALETALGCTAVHVPRGVLVPWRRH